MFSWVHDLVDIPKVDFQVVLVNVKNVTPLLPVTSVVLGSFEGT